MQRFSELLNAIVDRTTFDLGQDKIISPGQLREICERRSWHSQDSSRARNARVIVPEHLLRKLCELIRMLCRVYVEPSTDRIGHAFPIHIDSSERYTTDASGVFGYEATSPVEAFTKSIVRGAAVLGTSSVTSLVSDWLQEKPVSYSTRAVLNGAEFVTEPLKLMDGVRIESLPLSTNQLIEFLPLPNDLSLKGYLGRMVLTIDYSATPALFRPAPALLRLGNKQSDAKCQHTAVPKADFATVCQALALELDTYVEVAFFWNDFNALKAFALKKTELIWSAKQTRFGSRPYTNLTMTTDESRGVTTLKPGDGPCSQPDEEKLINTLNVLVDSDKMQIPTSRWMKSKGSGTSLTDKFIELRIALESLFLRDFDPNTMGEISFKLAIFGAWYLGTDFEERMNIRKKLHDAYSISSRAVHSGHVDSTSKNQELLSAAQALCRRGILKLLKEGAPNDWGDLILGGLEKTEST